MNRKDTGLDGYAPLTWDADSKLSKSEQEAVERNRRDLYRGGVRGKNLERMAFEFGYVECLLKENQCNQNTTSDGQ